MPGNLKSHPPPEPITISDAEFDKRSLQQALSALKQGNFSIKLPADWSGLDGKIADTFNEIVDLNQHMAHELEKASCRSGPQWARPKGLGPRPSMQ